MKNKERILQALRRDNEKTLRYLADKPGTTVGKMARVVLAERQGR